MASMSRAPRVRSLNVAPAEARSVLVPGGNKAMSGPENARKPASKSVRKAAPATVAAPPVAVMEEKKEVQTSAAAGGGAAAMVSSPVLPLRSLDLSLNVSCSSDTSVESFHSGGSTGRIGSVNVMSPVSRNKPGVPKQGKVVNKDVTEGTVVATGPTEFVQGRRRCAWVTSTTGMGSSCP